MLDGTGNTHGDVDFRRNLLFVILICKSWEPPFVDEGFGNAEGAVYAVQISSIAFMPSSFWNAAAGAERCQPIQWTGFGKRSDCFKAGALLGSSSIAAEIDLFLDDSPLRDVLGLVPCGKSCR